MKDAISRLGLGLSLVLALSLVACDDDDHFSPPPTAAMDWALIDGCDDGFGIQAVIFDVTHDVVWPARDQVYFAEPGGVISVGIVCERGAQICYGAETDPPSDIFWGIGLDGLAGCDDCCEPCGEVLVEFELICGAGGGANVRTSEAKPKVVVK